MKDNYHYESMERVIQPPQKQPLQEQLPQEQPPQEQPPQEQLYYIIEMAANSYDPEKIFHVNANGEIIGQINDTIQTLHRKGYKEYRR